MSRSHQGTGVRALLAPSVVVAVGTAVLCAAVALLVEGPHALPAVGLGSALVLGFLLVGQLPVSQVAKGRGGLGAMLLLLGYTTRIALLLAAFRLVLRTGSPDRQVLGATVIAVGLGWTAGTVLSFLRWRPPVVDVDLPVTDDASGRPSGEVPADERPTSR